MRFRHFALLLIAYHLNADPWGKDADLCFSKEECSPLTYSSNLGIALSTLFIRFHQEVVSPADGPRSHYIPSSSQYALDAIQKYGFLKGWMYGCDRLMRENEDPWIYREVLGNDGRLLKWNPVR